MDVRTLAQDKPVVFVVGAMAHGRVHLKIVVVPIMGSSLLTLLQVEVDYTEKEVAISGYPLSAALTCTKICTAFEESWGIQ